MASLIRSGVRVDRRDGLQGWRRALARSSTLRIARDIRHVDDLGADGIEDREAKHRALLAAGYRFEAQLDREQHRAVRPPAVRRACAAAMRADRGAAAGSRLGPGKRSHCAAIPCGSGAYGWFRLAIASSAAGNTQTFFTPRSPNANAISASSDDEVGIAVGDLPGPPERIVHAKVVRGENAMSRRVENAASTC